MTTRARLYQCARCHCQVIICRHCDHGNVYCGPACSASARADSLHRAAAKHRSSRRGRFANAARQRRHRQRQQQKVTHQGSPSTQTGDLLPSALSRQQRIQIDEALFLPATVRCHFCQRSCGPFLRRGFVRTADRSRRLRSP